MCKQQGASAAAGVNMTHAPPQVNRGGSAKLVTLRLAL
jgi:hypothetical protein